MSKLLILIDGISGAGKTTFSWALAKEYNTEAVQVDLLLIEYLYGAEFTADSLKYDLSEEYHSMSSEKHDDFVKFISQRIHEKLNDENACVLILEGYMLTFMDFNVGYETIRITCNVHNYYVNEELVREEIKSEISKWLDNRITGKQLKDFAATTGINPMNTAIDVKIHIQEKLIAKFSPKTVYQHFDDLGLHRKSSDSPGKFQTISDIDYAGKTCMDIGCNQGYFSFQLWKRNAAEVHGIELCKTDFEMALKYKNCIYQAKNVNFVNKDFFDAQSTYADSSFDVILCFSVFHYFRERQDEFFRIAKRLLKKGGLLLLENGIYQENDEPLVHQYSRASTEMPCFYPNDKKLRMMANEFEVISVKSSPLQPSDIIPRFVYTFKK